MHTVELTDSVQRSPSAADEGEGSDHLVLDLDSGRYYTLSVSGSFAWSRFDGAASLAEIAKEMVETFEVELATAEKDLLDFAHRMHELELVAVGSEVTGASAGSGASDVSGASS